MYYWFPKVTGPHVPRAARAGQLLAHLRRHDADVLPDAHRRAARDAAARLHVPGRARLGRPTTWSRRSAASCSPPGSLLIVGEPRRAATAAARRRARPVARRRRSSGRSRRRRPHYNFAVIPTVSSPYPNWDARTASEDRRGSSAASSCSTAATRRRRRRSVDARARRGRSRCRPTRRGRSCSPLRSPLVVRAAAHGALRRPRRVFLGAARCSSLAAWHCARAGGGMTRRDALRRARAARACRTAGGGWRCFVATEATLFGTLIGTYFYLRFKTRTGRRRASSRRGRAAARAHRRARR